MKTDLWETFLSILKIPKQWWISPIKSNHINVNIYWMVGSGRERERERERKKAFKRKIRTWFQCLILAAKEASYFDRINITKNQLEYDRKNITLTNMNDGTWQKDCTNGHERLNMTEIPMKITEIFNFGHIHPVMFVVVIHFRSSSIIHVCRCDLFGLVQIFWSYSFGHVDSVKWFTLLPRKRKRNKKHKDEVFQNKQIFTFTAYLLHTLKKNMRNWWDVFHQTKTHRIYAQLVEVSKIILEIEIMLTNEEIDIL